MQKKKVGLEQPFISDVETKQHTASSFGLTDEEFWSKKGFVESKMDVVNSWRPSPIKVEHSIEITGSHLETLKKDARKALRGNQSPFPMDHLLEGSNKKSEEKYKNDFLLESVALYESSYEIIQQEVDWKYDPFKTPPDLSLLERHLKAKKNGYFDIYNPNTLMNTCSCCHLPLDKDPFRINCSRSDLAFLGAGNQIIYTNQL